MKAFALYEPHDRILISILVVPREIVREINGRIFRSRLMGL
jgi:hypothetical protein